MTAYLGKRLTMTVAVVLLTMIFLALLVHLVPGDPVTSDDIEALLGDNYAAFLGISSATTSSVT